MENSTICPHCQFKLQSAPEAANWEEPSISDGDEVEFENSKTYNWHRTTAFSRGSVHSAGVGFLWLNVMAASTGT